MMMYNKYWGLDELVIDDDLCPNLEFTWIKRRINKILNIFMNMHQTKTIVCVLICLLLSLSVVLVNEARNHKSSRKLIERHCKKNNYCLFWVVLFFSTVQKFGGAREAWFLGSWGIVKLKIIGDGGHARFWVTFQVMPRSWTNVQKIRTYCSFYFTE